MRRKVTSSAIEQARSHFDRGAEVVYLYVDGEGNVCVTMDPPDQRVFVAARTLIQVERYVAEVHRPTA